MFRTRRWMPTVVIVAGLVLSSIIAGMAAERYVSEWEEPFSSPVFSGDQRAYYPTILEVAGVLHMWYTDKDASGYRIAHTTSVDGVNWTAPTMVTGCFGQPHHAVVANVGTDASPSYRIWYANSSQWPYQADLFRTAQSEDGITWTHDQLMGQADPLVRENDSDNPAYKWIYGSYGPGAVLYNPDGYSTVNSADPMGNKYVMYYDQYTRYWLTGVNEVTMMAVSADGINWTRYGDTPVLEPGGTTVWDGQYAYMNAIIEIDGVYHAWYSGGISDSNDGIGYAYSTDGITWIKAEQPVLYADDPSAPSWRATRTYAMAVIQSAESYRMWLSGKDGSDYVIGYASADGPYPTIQMAIDVSSPGDTIQITAGAYEEDVSVSQSLMLLGPNARIDPVTSPAGRMPEAVLTGGMQVVAEGVEVRGLTFDGGTSGWVIGTGADAHGLIVADNIFINNYGHAVAHFDSTLSDVQILRNVIEQTTGPSSSGLFLNGLRNSVIEGNAISNTGYAGMILPDADGLVLRGNSIDSIPQQGIQLSGSPAPNGNLITENTFTNTVFTDDDDKGAISLYADVHNTIITYNVLTGNYRAVVVRHLEKGEVPDTIHVNFNSIWGNREATGLVDDPGQYIGGQLDATLNWWGDAEGPSHSSSPLGAGDAVTDHVIFSPWLGIDPDGDASAVGVQILSPMLIIVDDIGPAPADGYLNQAIFGSNELPFQDTIEVRGGTYAGDEPITDGVTLYNGAGATADTVLNGPITIAAADVLLGRFGQGFVIRGAVTVAAGVDASTIHINWNDLFDLVTNNDGDNTLDATFNYWGEDGPDTFGLVAINPILPESADIIIGYMDEFDLNALEAIDFSYLLDELNLQKRALVALDLMETFGFSLEDALELIDTYKWNKVRNALRKCNGDYDQFLVLLVGYAVEGPAGGGGGVDGEIEVYVAGDLVPLALELLNPITGEVVDDALVSYSVSRTLPDGSPEIVAFGVMSFDGDAGAFVADVDTTGLEPGIYDVYLGTDDGRSQHVQIEITEV